MSSSIDSTELAVLQEYADNRGVRLRVDREKGVISGVKLLGMLSRKGREYPKEVMARALPLYEGMRVNVDHVDPGQRRSLRDRIGLVRNVTLREDGLYGDFHFNPKHALAEQIAWDAENAPQNLGFSHDTRGTSRTSGGRVVVESIDKVLSVDLVANPATTAGLFEDDAGSGELGAGGAPAQRVGEQGVESAEQDGTVLPSAPGSPLQAPNSPLPAMYESDGKRTTPAQKRTRVLQALAGWQDSINALSLPAGDANTRESTDMDWKDIELDGLKKNRPELLTALQESADTSSADASSARKDDEWKALQEEIKALRQEKAARDLQESIAGELNAAGLDPTNAVHVSEVFLEDLRTTADAAVRKAKIDDRKQLVGAARPVSSVPNTGAIPMQETGDSASIPPASAPLAQRIARFTR